ncbi:zwei Ig domain protein zig-8 [Condylostylus longicornis]|uniref:zwei Ig domain protein zig-8 n=1 Tax=Condylostylus longicornis TaxID=2530218 RepID=UPI00244E597D|nr:zwei Ig domain protein zig-8 [Condylostylus longicornis]XP_055388200.1 zwei Ig domain protein zig-8 [Condylostylus longicornis]XP_055388201.1 zwei Ig domain protein zig-8 [Condylostylus longicornis]XP_055388202.1 zwei Ig domain protein zig-8 [Condylostylus longicornis]
MEIKNIYGLICVLIAMLNKSSSTILKRPKAGDPFDSFPKNFWEDFSSPFTEIPENEDGLLTESTTVHEPFPFFADFYTNMNVSAQIGTHVDLHCRVNDLQGKTVSWMRRKGDDLALLTIGKHVYSSDTKYSIEFLDPNDWKLNIKYISREDEGEYECQVSSHPPLILLINLHIIATKIEVLGETGSLYSDKYYKTGSTIELSCIISKTNDLNSIITWKHDLKFINFESLRGGISVKSESFSDHAVSRLYIANAKKQDSGNYTCMLNNESKATVTVHVLSGEYPAAMQHSGTIKYGMITVTLLLSFILFLAR